MEENNLKKTLEDIGFTNGESLVYLTLLRIGESKVGPIINNSGISRSKVYDILEKLITRGVVSKIEKNKVLFYQSLSPQTILRFIKEKQTKLKEEENLINQIMPQLTSLLPKRDIDIKVYQGIDGFKSVIERTIAELKKDDIYKAMGISKTTESMRNYALKIYQAQKEKHFKAQSIFDEEGAHKIEERKTKWHKIRILPKGWNTPALFTIYGDTVGIHTGNQDTIISIVIKNKEIAKSFNTNFEAMWKIAKK